MPFIETILANDPFFREAMRDPFFCVFDQPLLEGTTNNNAAAHKDSQRIGSYFRFPRMDMTENEKEYIVKADLPGMKKEDVHIHVQDRVLTIEGERKDEKEEKRENHHFIERSYGKFSRSIKLPVDANVENTQAAINHGVLELKISKIPSEASRKKISIN